MFKNLIIVLALISAANAYSFISYDKDFSGQDLSGMDFSKKNLDGANFENAILVNANFKGAKLKSARFQNTDLTGASFYNAKMYNVNFYGANMAGADLRKAFMNGCWLVTTDLSKAIIDETTSMNGCGYSTKRTQLPEYWEFPLVEASKHGMLPYIRE